MRIEFERTGGFAGLRTALTVDTEALTPEAAHELRGLIEAAQFFALPAALASPTPAADQFQYRLTVDDAGHSHTLTTSDAAAPEPLQAVLRKLTAMARARRNS